MSEQEKKLGDEEPQEQVASHHHDEEEEDDGAEADASPSSESEEEDDEDDSRDEDYVEESDRGDSGSEDDKPPKKKKPKKEKKPDVRNCTFCNRQYSQSSFPGGYQCGNAMTAGEWSLEYPNRRCKRICCMPCLNSGVAGYGWRMCCCGDEQTDYIWCDQCSPKMKRCAECEKLFCKECKKREAVRRKRGWLCFDCD